MCCFFSSNELQPRNFAEVFRKFEVTYLTLSKNCRSTHNKSSRNSFCMEIKLYILNKRELKLPIIKKTDHTLMQQFPMEKIHIHFFQFFIYFYSETSQQTPSELQNRTRYIESCLLHRSSRVSRCQGISVSGCQGMVQ